MDKAREKNCKAAFTFAVQDDAIRQTTYITHCLLSYLPKFCDTWEAETIYHE